MGEIRDAIYSIAIFLTFVGALNWGIIGLTDVDLIQVGFPPALHHAIYLLIGVMALYALLCYRNII